MTGHDLASMYEFSYFAISQQLSPPTDAACLLGANATLIANR